MRLIACGVSISGHLDRKASGDTSIGKCVLKWIQELEGLI